MFLNLAYTSMLASLIKKQFGDSIKVIICSHVHGGVVTSTPPHQLAKIIKHRASIEQWQKMIRIMYYWQLNLIKT